MKNQIFYKLKKYFVPLIVVFLFSKAKAESIIDSAFSDIGIYIKANQDSLTNKYNTAEKLFIDGNESKSSELAYSLLGVNDNLIKMRANHLLSKIYQKNNDLDKALIYTHKSINLHGQIIVDEYDNNAKNKYQKIEAENLRFLGRIYFLKNKKDSSFFYLNKLIKIKSLNKEVLYSQALGLNNLSALNSREKNYSEAEKLSHQAIKIFEDMNAHNDLSMAHINLANNYEVTNKREKALETYFKALSYVEGKNDDKAIEHKEMLYYNIAWTMYNLKDYKAYEYLEKSYELKDSIININLRKELKKIEQTHNIDLIRKEAENKRLSLVRNNWFIGITGALVSLLLLYLVNLNKLKKKDLELQLSQKEYEQQKRIDSLQLEAQTKILNATIDGKETERKQIAETLHDNVSALLSSANMHLQASEKHFANKPPVELEKTKQIITEASQKIRDLSHTLVSSILLKFGLEYAVKDTAKKYSNSSIKIHTAIGDIHRYQQDFEIRVYNIIQELINNILKHSKASTAFIAMEESNEKLLVIVKDTGVGFKKKSKEETGIGLTQIEARVRIMDGAFTIETKENEGTKITLEIPIIPRKVTINA